MRVDSGPDSAANRTRPDQTGVRSGVRDEKVLKLEKITIDFRFIRSMFVDVLTGFSKIEASAPGRDLLQHSRQLALLLRPGVFARHERIHMLILTRKKSETIRIGTDIEISVIRLSKKCVKLGINAPPGLEIHRDDMQTDVAGTKLARIFRPPTDPAN